MRRLARMLLVLTLAGCSSTDWFHQNEPERPAALPAQEAPKQGMQTIPSQRNLSPAATATPSAKASVSTGELMDCVPRPAKSIAHRRWHRDSDQNGAPISKSRSQTSFRAKRRTYGLDDPAMRH